MAVFVAALAGPPTGEPAVVRTSSPAPSFERLLAAAPPDFALLIEAIASAEPAATALAPPVAVAVAEPALPLAEMLTFAEALPPVPL